MENPIDIFNLFRYVVRSFIEATRRKEMTVETPSAEVFIGKIERNLPDPNDSRSRIVLLRALLLLIGVRSLPSFMIFSIKLIASLGESLTWKERRARFELNNIVPIFSELDDSTIAAIEKRLRELLEEATPADSLKKYLAKAFGATCVETDHVAKVGDNPSARILMTEITLENSLAALEDFTVKVASGIPDTEIRKAIDAFYKEQGFQTVDGDDNFIYAQTGILGLLVKFTNYSDNADGYIMVTVTEE
jgi:hypothetical protein